MNIDEFYKNDGLNDLSDIIKNAQDEYKINIPKDNGWRCQIMEGVLWQPPNGNAPNWFHRKMQELFFGVKWFNENK